MKIKSLVSGGGNADTFRVAALIQTEAVLLNRITVLIRFSKICHYIPADATYRRDSGTVLCEAHSNTNCLLLTLPDYTRADVCYK